MFENLLACSPIMTRKLLVKSHVSSFSMAFTQKLKNKTKLKQTNQPTTKLLTYTFEPLLHWSDEVLETRNSTAQGKAAVAETAAGYSSLVLPFTLMATCYD